MTRPARREDLDALARRVDGLIEDGEGCKQVFYRSPAALADKVTAAGGLHAAFAIGGEVRPGEMDAENLALMARQLGMQPRFLAQQARDMADRVPTALDQAAREIAPALTPSARTLAERLERFVSSTTKKLAARLTAAP